MSETDRMLLSEFSTLHPAEKADVMMYIAKINAKKMTAKKKIQKRSKQTFIFIIAQEYKKVNRKEQKNANRN